MALINCPECGKEISDKAKVCINCGCPISEINPAGSVSILMTGTGHIPFQMYILDMETKKELWTGKSGEVARFNVDKETEIAIVDSTCLKKPEKYGTKAIVRGSRKYEYKSVPTLFSFKLVITEVDVIDSGI